MVTHDIITYMSRHKSEISPNLNQQLCNISSWSFHGHSVRYLTRSLLQRDTHQKIGHIKCVKNDFAFHIHHLHYTYWQRADRFKNLASERESEASIYSSTNLLIIFYHTLPISLLKGAFMVRVSAMSWLTSTIQWDEQQINSRATDFAARDMKAYIVGINAIVEVTVYI